MRSPLSLICHAVAVFTCCLISAVAAATLAPSPPPIPPGETAAEIFLNVKSAPYGAVGDGVTDDAPAINRALEAVRKRMDYGGQGKQGMVVYIPPGIYRLDAPLDLNGRQFNLMGAGSYQTVLRGNTG